MHTVIEKDYRTIESIQIEAIAIATKKRKAKLFDDGNYRRKRRR